MRQVFSAYPAGIAGAALLVLRISVIFALLSRPSHTFELEAYPSIITLPLILALALGILTRIACFMTLAAVSLLPGALPMPANLPVTEILDALALMMAGPGALSVDAYIFGRATIDLSR